MGGARGGQRGDRSGDDELSSLLEAKNAAEARSAPADLARAECALGVYYEGLGDYASAVGAHRRELKARRALNDKLGAAVATRHVGECLTHMCEFDEAHKQLARYLALARDARSAVEEQRAHVTIGRAYYVQAASLGGSPGPTGSRRRHRLVAAARRAYDEAERSLDRLRAGGDVAATECDRMMVGLRLNQGLLHDMDGDRERACDAIKEAETRARKLGDSAEVCRCLQSLSDVHYRCGDVPLAVEKARQACAAAAASASRTAADEEAVGRERSARVALARLLVEAGDVRGALRCLRKAGYGHCTAAAAAGGRPSEASGNIGGCDDCDDDEADEDVRFARNACRMLQLLEKVEPVSGTRVPAAAAGATSRGSGVAVATAAANVGVDNDRQARVYDRLGDCAASSGCFHAALKYYGRSLAAAKAAGWSDLAPIYVSLAETCFDLRRYQDASKYYLDELRIRVGRRELAEAARTQMRIAECAIQLGRPASAVSKTYAMAHESAVASGNRQQQLEVCRAWLAYVSRAPEDPTEQSAASSLKLADILVDGGASGSACDGGEDDDRSSTVDRGQLRAEINELQRELAVCSDSAVGVAAAARAKSSGGGSGDSDDADGGFVSAVAEGVSVDVDDDWYSIRDDLQLCQLVSGSEDENSDPAIALSSPSAATRGINAVLRRIKPNCRNKQKEKADEPRKISIKTVSRNRLGETELHRACISGRLDKVVNLIERGHPVNVRDNAGWTPLHEACNHGYTAIVECLLDAGADIDDRGGAECDGLTPLLDAARAGQPDVIELLLRRGANVLAKNDGGQTAIECLIEFEQDDGQRLPAAKRQRLRDAERLLKAAVDEASASVARRHKDTRLKQPIGSLAIKAPSSAASLQQRRREAPAAGVRQLRCHSDTSTEVVGRAPEPRYAGRRASSSSSSSEGDGSTSVRRRHALSRSKTLANSDSSEEGRERSHGSSASVYDRRESASGAQLDGEAAYRAAIAAVRRSALRPARELGRTASDQRQSADDAAADDSLVASPRSSAIRRRSWSSSSGDGDDWLVQDVRTSRKRQKVTTAAYLGTCLRQSTSTAKDQASSPDEGTRAVNSVDDDSAALEDIATTLDPADPARRRSYGDYGDNCSIRELNGQTEPSSAATLAESFGHTPVRAPQPVIAGGAYSRPAGSSARRLQHDFPATVADRGSSSSCTSPASHGSFVDLTHSAVAASLPSTPHADAVPLRVSVRFGPSVILVTVPRHPATTVAHVAREACRRYAQLAGSGSAAIESVALLMDCDGAQLLPDDSVCAVLRDGDKLRAIVGGRDVTATVSAAADSPVTARAEASRTALPASDDEPAVRSAAGTLQNALCVGGSRSKQLRSKSLVDIYSSLCQQRHVAERENIRAAMAAADRNGRLLLAGFCASLTVSALLVDSLSLASRRDGGDLLCELDLSGNWLGDAGAERLAPVLGHLACLRSLDVSANGIAAAGLGHLAKPFVAFERDPIAMQRPLSQPLRALEVLCVSSNFFDSAEAADWLAAIVGGLPRLRTLRAAACGLGVAAIGRRDAPLCVALSRRSATLDTLDMPLNAPGLLGLKCLVKHALNLRLLRALDVSGAAATGSAVATVAPSKSPLLWLAAAGAPMLESLGLAECDLSPADARELVRLGRSSAAVPGGGGSRLRSLSLRGNGRLGAAELADVLCAFDSLDRLDVSWCCAAPSAATPSALLAAIRAKMQSAKPLQHLSLGPSSWCRKVLATGGDSGDVVSLMDIWHAVWTTSAACAWHGDVLVLSRREPCPTAQRF